MPGTLAPDGDPLDVLVLLEELVAVPATDPRWAGTRGLDDLPEHLTREIG